MIDFLISLIEGSETMVQASHSVAPIVWAALSMATQGIQGKQARDKEAARLAELSKFSAADRATAEKELAALKAGELQFAPTEEKVSDYAYKAYDISQSRAAEDAIKEQQDAALATMASTGNIGSGMYNAFMDQTTKAALMGLEGRQKGAADLASLEQSTLARNAAMREAARVGELQNALGRQRTGEIGQYQVASGRAGLAADKKNAFTDALLTGATSYLTAGGGDDLFNKKTVGTENPTKDVVDKVLPKITPTGGSGMGGMQFDLADMDNWFKGLSPTEKAEIMRKLTK